MTRHVIFDFDGTLVDSAPAIIATLERTVLKHGLQPLRQAGRDMIGPPLLATLSGYTGVSDVALLEALAHSFKQVYDSEGIEATLLYPGIAPLLQQLQSSGCRLWLATNKRQRPTELLLDKFGLRPLFSSVYCLDTRQPPYADKTRMLIELLGEQGIKAADAVYVGDTCHDERAAAGAGLAFIGVAWGYGSGEQRLSSHAVCATDAVALATVITQHFFGGTRA